MMNFFRQSPAGCRIHLVLNRFDKKTAAVPVSVIESQLSRKVDAIVNEDRAILRSVNEGKLLRDIDRKAPAKARAFFVAL